MQLNREDSLVRSSMIAAYAAVCFAALALASPGLADTADSDARQEACKKAMNDRIQICTDDCTSRALAAASNYVDTNHNVKFGCLKGCAIGQIFQMRACVAGKSVPGGDPTETNQ